jgi:ribosomal protein L11 methyltransferase
MYLLEFETSDDQKDIWIAELADFGSTGIVEIDLPERRSRVRAFFESDAGLLDRFAELAPRIEPCRETGWIAVSQAAWAPRRVGRFFLVPEWMNDPAPEGCLRISVNPGLACGTGAHAATRQCLQALERYVRPGSTVVDVGCGAGILSVAAALLGAGRVVACDNDPVAVEIAARNVASVFVGSAESILPGLADLIVCNISASVNCYLAPVLKQCLTPQGLCVSAGFEKFEEQAVTASIIAAAGVVIEVLAENSWRALVWR